MPDLTSDLARFWTKVDKTDTCWLWTASRMNGGYGAFSSSILGPHHSAHVFAYVVFVGPVPDGKELDHTCHVEHCCNPWHLRPVTKLVNQHNRKGANGNGSSGYRNVHKTKAGTWSVNFKLDGTVHYGGTFKTPEQANDAAAALREKLWTERNKRKPGCQKHGFEDGYYEENTAGRKHWRCRSCRRERAAKSALYVSPALATTPELHSD